MGPVGPSNAEELLIQTSLWLSAGQKFRVDRYVEIGCQFTDGICDSLSFVKTTVYMLLKKPIFVTCFKLEASI